ncbi:MAG: hypothetical protein R8G01_14970 [Ilumatobacteraceae bacterium]|nr:hypothetical protein [Ilumatobacteraceae bacterium]
MAVDDFGTVIAPLSVLGQQHGGNAAVLLVRPCSSESATTSMPIPSRRISPTTVWPLQANSRR